MSVVGDVPSPAMLGAMAELWRLSPPGPDNILAHPAFVRLREACRDNYSGTGKTGPAFALSTALRALGLLCHLQKDAAHLALPVDEAAAGLDAALRSTRSTRVHLAPLDLADDLSPVAFGPAKLCRLTPDELRLDDNVATELTVWDQSRWVIVEQAKQSVLFETPVAHFLIRAFLAEGVDEFLAPITTIEAALGLRADYQKSFRVAPDRHKGMRATNRIRGRVAGLLGDRSHADQYEQLFDIRSAFLHGRVMTDISTQEQVMARSLARQVVEALILAAQSGQISSREDFLDRLLDKGAPLI